MCDTAEAERPTRTTRRGATVFTALASLSVLSVFVAFMRMSRIRVVIYVEPPEGIRRAEEVNLTQPLVAQMSPTADTLTSSFSVTQTIASGFPEDAAPKKISQSRGTRLLLYFATYPAHEQHLQFLETCWRRLLHRGRVLRRADVILFLGGEATSGQLSRWKSALQNLGVNATLQHDASNPGYQQGAMRAVHMLVTNGWWRGYDWVVRLNPDVLIYDDNYLEKFFQNHKLSAVLASCEHILGAKVHSDFFAVRPSRLPQDSFADWETYRGTAEYQATKVFQSIIQRKEHAWLLPENMDRACRVRGKLILLLIPAVVPSTLFTSIKQ